MALFSSLFGDPNARVVRTYEPIISRIGSLESDFQALDDAALRAKTAEYKERLAQDETLDDLLPEAFATIREAARRTLGQRHFDVQLMGGIALHRGHIAEMRTGEGKTLTATAPLYLNALAGQGVHLVTVNDYLAKFHAGWMGRVFEALGLTTGCVQHDEAFRYDPATKELVKCERREAYAADITYGTNNEFGFDYLRDNMVQRPQDMVQRALHYAIVDEVDSILIDEARTPLIISAAAEQSTDLYYRFADLMRQLVPQEDYKVDEKLKSSTLTAEGITKLEGLLNIPNIYSAENISTVHHIEQALRAHALYRLDRDYVVKEGEVIIVDEFTGRLMAGRRYSEGLHQAIEAKENVKIQRESQTLATITFQNYFRLFKKLSGMTGTAETEAEEFSKIYKLEVVVIPTHRPMVRSDEADRIYKTELGKFQAVVKEVRARHEKKQPVLIGTISIEKNELLSALLEADGIPHQMLNAKNHAREADIIAEAGRIGAVTLATNMAGRGVDIILGGSAPERSDEAAYEAWQKDHDAVLMVGGLHVIGTERHESRRIDNQLRGRAGRQGDPGSSQFYVSLDDDLMRIFGSERIRSMMERLGVPDDMPIENRMVSKALETAQRKVEGHNFDIRKHLVEYDDVVNKHRDVIYTLRRRLLTAGQAALRSDDLATEGAPDETITEEIISLVKEEVSELLRRQQATVVNDETEFAENPGKADEELLTVLRTMLPISAETEAFIRQLNEPHEHEIALVRHEQIAEAVETDARRELEAVKKNVNEKLGPEAFINIARGILLNSIDTLWIEHLEAIDHLRQGIGLRGYGQRDPLVEYKREAFGLFEELLDLVRKQVVHTIFKVQIAMNVAQPVPASPMAKSNITLSAPAKTMEEGLTMNSSAPASATQSATVHNEPKIGRNEPCSCGSGKKYKKCHGK